MSLPNQQWSENVKFTRVHDSQTGSRVPDTMSQELSTHPAQVLFELFELLEEYSPAWYRQEHHDRAVGALMQQ
jgi:hypothetical protein